MATMTTASNPASLQVYYEKKLLSVLEPRLVLAQLGMKARIPQSQGPTIRWTRYSSIGANTTPLTEGTNPSEVSVATQNIDAASLQYGQFAKVSDKLRFHAIDPVIRNLSERFGWAAAKTVEDLIVAELDAEAAVQLVDGATIDDISQSEVLDHKQLIEAQINQKEDLIPEHESGQYVAVLNPGAEFDLKSDTQIGSWLDLNKYVGGEQRKLLNGEFGNMYGIRLLVSDRMSEETNASTVKIRKTYMVGMEAFGVVDLRGAKRIEMLVKDERSGGVSNPLNMFGTVGYKLKGYATKYLDSGSKRVIQIKAASGIDA